MATNTLTASQVRSFKPGPSLVKRADGGGLNLHVAPSGEKFWSLAYRHGGKQRTMSLGAYPSVSLAEARAARDRAKALLRDGVDPKEARKASVSGAAPPPEEPQGPTWREVGEEFLSKVEREGKAARTIKKQWSQFRLTLDALGPRPIAELRPKDVLDMLRPIEARGRYTSVSELRALCSRIFRYGAAATYCESDPAAMLKGALTQAPESHYPALFDPKAVGGLVRAIRGYDGDVATRAGLLLALYTMLRPGEVRFMEWGDVDAEGAMLAIPAERMKMPRPHKVPLSRQALAVLEFMRPVTGKRRHVLASLRAEERPISDMTLNAGLRRLGYPQGSVTVHGFRRTASTMLNEMGWNRDWIERQLAHVEGNSVRRAYNAAEFMEGRTQMMQAWADHLDTLADAPAG